MDRRLQYGVALGMWLFWCGFSPNRSGAQSLSADPAAEKARKEILLLADQKWQAGAYFEAGNEYRKIVETEPANLYAAYRLAECYRYTFDYKAAEALYAKVYQEDNQAYPLALYYQALMLRHNRSHVDALIRFDQFIQQATAPDAKPEIVAFVAKARLEKTGIETALSEPKPDLSYFERFRLGDLSSEYKLKADKIIRRKEAGRMHKEEMPLYGEDAFFYNEQLSQSERSKVGKITAVGLFNLNPRQMDTIYQADQNYFGKLPESERARINRFAVAYRRAVDNNERVILTEDDDTYYHLLSLAARSRLDRVIAFRMHEAISSQMARMKNKRQRLEEIDAVENVPVASLSDERQPVHVSLTEAEIRAEDLRYYNSLPENEKDRIDRILEARRLTKRTGAALALNQEDQLYYSKLSEQEKARLDRLADTLPSHSKRALTPAELRAEDLRYYHSLPETEKDRVDRILESIRLAKRLGAALVLGPEDQLFYSKLSEQEKVRLDRLADILPSPAKRALTPAELRAEDLRYYNNLPEAEKERVDRILEASRLAKRTSAALALNQEDQLYYSKLSEQEKDRLDRLADILPSPAKRALTLAEQLGEDRRYYNSLPEQEKKRIDRILAAKRLATRTGAGLVLSPEDQNYYNTLSEVDIARLDRLAEVGTGEASLQANSLLQPASDPTEKPDLAHRMEATAPETIFFNFDQYALRKEARKALDDLSDFIRKHPTARVEIHAFADDLGDETYNHVLCLKRGKAVEEYLSRQGVDAAILEVKAWGKQPTLVNLPDSNYARQLNRRVDFHLTGVPENYVWKTRMYILQPDANLSSVAKAFGLTLHELMALNGIKSERIEAYQPIRVKNAGSVVPTPMVKDPRVALGR